MTRPTSAGNSRWRILFADDESQIRALVGLMLTRAGYDVDTVGDGLEAWAALLSQSYDLLITDQDMPLLTGIELVGKARQAGIRLPIIMTSAGFNFPPASTQQELDLAAWLPKPFSFAALVGTVKQVLPAVN
jgi:two-component system chemotaxis response regulator CheY